MRSWKETLRLPRSSFKPRPNLQLLRNDREAAALYQWQATHRPQDDLFVLHDGPPYANGPLHLGHALNKVLKDMVLRLQVQKGKRVLYRPGWDCHGLPTEMKALEADAATALSPVGIRQSAKRLATEAIAGQLKGFQSFGVMAAWDDKWTTMDHAFEMRQLRIFQKMLRHGLIYRKYKPVYWSTTSRTALAEAELEYRDDHVSQAAYIRYPIVSGCSAIPELADFTHGLYAAIWTTTPWTLPANRAIAVHRHLLYSVLRVGDYGLIVASSRVEALRKHLPSFEVAIEAISGEKLAGLQYRNKLRGKPAPSQPIVHADFVSADSGTGLVHMAPGHGQEDYEACSTLGIAAFAPIDDDGHFTPEAFPDHPQLLTEAPSILQGGSQAVLDLVGDDVLAVHELRHKYPYDWRTKQPVVLRATAQWFADVGGIKEAALAALRRVRFVPESGRARLESFIKRRREWCISRQRCWGVPIPALYDADGKAVMTNESVEHIISVMQERTSEAWFSDAADDAAWIAPSLKEGRYHRGTETMDVWFDSGSSWTETTQQADVYLEGSDQHRGWFQSSLLTYVAEQKLDGMTDDQVKAPFKTLVTHGFVLDAQGKKMSKSVGNTISPDELILGHLSPPRDKTRAGKGGKADALGPDALRLWVASSDFTTDVLIGPSIMQPVHNALVKYRTVLKMILGSLHQSSRSATLTKVDQIAIMQLGDTMKQVQDATDAYEFSKATALINRWVANDLSAFYLEALKDRLYCGDGGGALEPMLVGFLRMLAPITPFLVDEAWSNRPQWMADDETLQHPGRQLYGEPVVDACRLTMAQSRLRRDLPVLMAVRGAVRAGLEEARAAGALGSSLQSLVVISTEDSELAATLGFYLDELDAMLVVSQVGLNEGTANHGGDWSFVKPFRGGTVHVLPPRHHKCARCWRYLATSEHQLCGRCDEAVQRQVVKGS